MKPVFVPSTLRTLVTSLVIVSLTGQQIAFASGLSATNPPTASAAITPPLADVHSALPLAKTGKQGVMVVELAESRPFSSYFEKGGSPAEIDRLNADLKNLAVANSLVGIADDLEGFQKWWPAHQTSILLSHSKLQNENLE